MRVLVTGGCGFIGRKLIAGLDQDALNIDLHTNFDIREDKALEWIRDYDPEIVFHLAAVHHVPWCREHPEETLSVNVDGTDALLASLGQSVKSVVLASSAAVYGWGEQPFFEDSLPAPADVYGKSKVGAEQLLQGFSSLHPKARCVAARLFNVVGPGDQTPHVVPEMAAALARGEREIVCGNTWPLRDYVHVDDVADALRTFAVRAPHGYSEFNVCSGRGTSIQDLADCFSSIVRERVTLAPDIARSRGNDGHLMGNPMKTGLDLGWSGRRTLRDALEAVLEEKR